MPTCQTSLFLALSWGLALPLAVAALPPALSHVERDRVRFHLENAYYEAQLLIRNHELNHRDLERQDRELQGMGVYDRFPLSENLADLQDQFRDSARDSGLRFESLAPRPAPREKTVAKAPEPKMPDHIFTADRDFHLTETQLVQEIPVSLRVRGEGPEIERWIANWPRKLLRWVEARGKPHRQRDGDFEIAAVAYRFRPLHYPKLDFRDPLAYLPDWAQKDPSRFAREAPDLWARLEGARALFPQARPYLGDRERFLLNDARISFYLRKVGR